MSEMNELLREVQEDLRQERIEKVWKQYGKYFIAGLVAIVFSTAAFVLWKDYRTDQRTKESIAYNQAIEFISQGKIEKGLTQLSELTETGNAYNGIAALNKAAILATKDETKTEAIGLYDAISKDRKYAATIRYLAGYYAILHQIETADSDALLSQLSLLMVGSNPWSIMVTELKAILTLKAGRQEEAAQIYKDLLNNNNAPPGVRMRAQASLSQIQIS